MNKKVIAREWLIFLASCIAFFPLSFVVRLFDVSILPLMLVGMPLIYFLVLVVRLTIWAIRVVRGRA